MPDEIEDNEVGCGIIYVYGTRTTRVFGLTEDELRDLGDWGNYQYRRRLVNRIISETKFDEPPQ